MPNVVMEAMAAGVPTIATDAGATRELITHGVDGFVAKVGDIDAMAAYLKNVINSIARYNAVSRAGQQTIRDRFDFQKSVDEFEQLLIS